MKASCVYPIPDVSRDAFPQVFVESVDKWKGCKWIWQPLRGNAQYLRRRSIGRQEQVRPVENKSSGRQTDWWELSAVEEERDTSDEQATGWLALVEMAPRVPRGLNEFPLWSRFFFHKRLI